MCEIAFRHALVPIVVSKVVKEAVAVDLKHKIYRLLVSLSQCCA